MGSITCGPDYRSNLISIDGVYAKTPRFLASALHSCQNYLSRTALQAPQSNQSKYKDPQCSVLRLMCLDSAPLDFPLA